MVNTGNSLSAVLVSVIVAGCSTLIDKEGIKLEIYQSESVRIIEAKANRDKNEVVIRGTAKFPYWDDYGYFKGHVDAEVEMANGEKILLHSAKLKRESRTRKWGQQADFTLRIPLQLPKETLVELEYHEDNKPQD